MPVSSRESSQGRESDSAIFPYVAIAPHIIHPSSKHWYIGCLYE